MIWSDASKFSYSTTAKDGGRRVSALPPGVRQDQGTRLPGDVGASFPELLKAIEAEPRTTCWPSYWRASLRCSRAPREGLPWGCWIRGIGDFAGQTLVEHFKLLGGNGPENAPAARRITTKAWRNSSRTRMMRTFIYSLQGRRRDHAMFCHPHGEAFSLPAFERLLPTYQATRTNSTWSDLTVGFLHL